MTVKPKKRLGQHFLKDLNISRKIHDSLAANNVNHILEIGPGMGVLTQHFLEDRSKGFHAIDLDLESIEYLKENYPLHKDQFIYGDFLKLNFDDYFGSEPIAIVGNFPYNISSQIFFKTLENRGQVVEVVGMIQKEVAERIVSKEGNKIYGILSVLLQTYYDIEYLFSVPPNVFLPPPKVMSAVIRLKRNKLIRLDCDEKLFFKVVKEGFQKRRKTLRNALKHLNLPDSVTSEPIFNLRAEQLSVQEFIRLVKIVEPWS